MEVKGALGDRTCNGRLVEGVSDRWVRYSEEVREE